MRVKLLCVRTGPRGGERGFRAQGAEEGGGTFEEFFPSALKGHNVLLFSADAVYCMAPSL